MGEYDYQIGQRQNRGTNPLVKVLLGIAVIAIGVYAGNVLYTKYLIYQAEQAVMELTKGFQLETERSRQHQLALEQERTRQKQLELDYKREQIERQVAHLEADKAKEAAWNRFYKRPARCENVSKQEVLVECGNYYVKEKNKFEQMWMANQNSNAKIILH